jgi:hypothetical protein
MLDLAMEQTKRRNPNHREESQLTASLIKRPTTTKI